MMGSVGKRNPPNAEDDTRPTRRKRTRTIWQLSPIDTGQAQCNSDPDMIRTPRQRATVVTGMAVVSSAATYARRRAHRARWAPPGGHVVQTSSLSARVLGETGPPVLLLHGLVASSLYWGGAYDRLAAHRRLVVPDLLGFGRSPRPASGYGPDGHADAVLACLDDLGIAEPVIIGAHSLGSVVAMRLAAIHPERVDAIVAFGPPVYADPGVARDHVSATSPMGHLFVLPGRTAENACRWVCDHRKLAARLAVVTHPSLPREIAADAVQHSWTSYSQTLLQVILAAQAATWVDQIDCPVHLVAGDRDPVVDCAYLRRLADAHVKIELSEVAGRHNFPLTDPAECTAMIAAAQSSGSRLA